jgi:hypothetical protein
MPTLILDDDELRALYLLTDVTRQPNRFPLSPKRPKPHARQSNAPPAPADLE